MKILLGLLVVFVFCTITTFSQVTYILTGQVTDENRSPLPGANVVLNSGLKGLITDRNGNFEIRGLASVKYFIEVSYMGYGKYQDTLDVRLKQYVSVQLKPLAQTLNEVVVMDNYAESRKREDPRNIEVVNSQYIKTNLSGSLMQSLDRLPGIGTIEIGSGQSKPVIRGLGFNRVVVVENGIKHEGQQWGAEHGLEIDQYAVDQIEIIKGPASLMYGSEAIGGIIELKQLETPTENTIGGSVDLTGKSNNNLMGVSANIYARKKRFFVTSRFTITDYADYRVPADSVDIYSYRAPLYKNRLRNTAGYEHDLHFSVGYLGKQFSNRLYVSNTRSKSGFFANAHGLEPRRVDTDLHDHSDRDIQYPFQEVNHFKVISKSDIRLDKIRIEAELGFQNNYREECNQYVPHGFMPPTFPDSMSFPADLELEFDKDVYSANLKSYFTVTDKLSVTSGINYDYQNNHIGGLGFIIPAYTQNSAGVFAYGKYSFSAKTILHVGLRFDYGNIKTIEYFDWFKSPVINVNGDTIGYDYLQRASNMNRKFGNFCWSVGINHNTNNFSLKANAGKSFRMPIAKELAANGVNYHHFSYEVGDANLDAEVSYQFDLGLGWNYSRFAIEVSPFFNYFPNYIYLNPSYKHDYLYGAGNQVYFYTQSEVMRFGGEVHLHYDVLKQLKAGLIGEYVYSEQLLGEKKGFTLPFSPPANILLNLKYSPQINKLLSEPFISMDFKIMAAQNNIVPPEKTSPGYRTVSISAGSKFKWNKQFITINLQVQNLFNHKYFNHTSYYRIINVPEPGRNFIVNISIPFSGEIKRK
jgi:iron complex outermembrane receptor protein